MPKLIILLLVALITLLPVASRANDADEIAKVSVRMYHQLCMGKIFNEPDALAILDKFPKLVEERANVFRQMLGADNTSEVWTINFPKATFVLVFEPEKMACHFMSPNIIPAKAVMQEFDVAIEDLEKSSAIKFKKYPVVENEGVTSFNVNYIFPAKELQLMNSVSLRHEQREDVVSSIYTMVIKGLQ